MIDELPTWMTTVVRDMRLHAEAALLRRLNAGAGFADSRLPSQVYLRDPAALARVSGGTLRPQGTHKKAADQLQRALAEATLEAAHTRMSTMISMLDIDPIGGALLAAALAYAVDLDMRELVHALAPRRKMALHIETCADIIQCEPAALLRVIAPGSSVRRGRVLHIEGDDLGSTVELMSHALGWLLGDDELQPPIAGLCELIAPDASLGVVLPTQVTDSLAALVAKAQLGHDVAIVLKGPRGSGRKAAAHRVASALGRPLLVIPVPVLLTAEKRYGASVLGPALAAAQLRGAVPFIADGDALYNESGDIAAEHAAAIQSIPGLFVAGSSGRGGHLELRRAQFIVAMPRTELVDRERAWKHALAAFKAPTVHAPELGARYVIGPGAIAEVVTEAHRFAQASMTPLDLDTLEGAIGRRLSLRLGTFGAVVSRKALMDELVLPEDVIDTLRDMIAMVRERAQILERWGYQRHLGISRGVAGLYSGEPGTGKTMAASVVASELGLELVRIDLSAVVSKYVGETEKNLGRIFDEAQDAHAMLLFDEADSLFGKRTELKSAQDRFANLEVNYILQRMETFDGVSVLTTNAENSIDPALQRRLNFRIRFPEPEVEERERLWKQLLPPATELHAHVDFHTLAERFDMTGGYIKNAIVRAAVIAARAGRSMVAEDLYMGAHHEYVEMGKVMPQMAPQPPRGL
jgi:MoxR-like ATPase